MISNAKNKDMADADKGQKLTPAAMPAQAGDEYFFSGGGEYLPCTVIANTQDEAIEKWKAARVKNPHFIIQN